MIPCFSGNLGVTLCVCGAISKSSTSKIRNTCYIYPQYSLGGEVHVAAMLTIYGTLGMISCETLLNIMSK